jgi:TPR repeat protein
MVPLRLLTSAGIFVGASLGALAAVWTGPVPAARGAPSTAPARPVLAESARPVLAEPPRQHPAAAEPAAPEPPVSVAAAAQTAPKSPEPAVAGPLREQALAPTAEAVNDAMLSCARGRDDDCLRAAEALEAGRGVPRDEKLARDFRATAVKRYAARCTRRDPDACHAFSMLHARGFGVKQDAESARVLLERARVACRTRPAAICARL